MEAFRGSELFATVAATPNFVNIVARDFAVLEGPTHATQPEVRVPAGAAVAVSPQPFGPGWAEFRAARARFLDGLRRRRRTAGTRAGSATTTVGHEPGATVLEHVLVTRRCGFDSPEELERAAGRSRAAGERAGSGVSWIRTYALAEGGGGLGTVCVFAADSADAIREHARAADLPIDEVIPVADMMIVRPDPAARRDLIFGAPRRRWVHRRRWRLRAPADPPPLRRAQPRGGGRASPRPPPP